MEIDISSFLLDKSVIRLVIQAIIRRSKKLIPTEDQLTALRVFQLTTVIVGGAYITRETYNILIKTQNKSVTQIVIPILKVLDRGKYFKRWARRLTDFGFTYEDAKIISSASFGVDLDAKKCGTAMLVTFDKKLIQIYEYNIQNIKQRFTRMTKDLPEPYCQTSLPTVLHSGDLVTILS